MRKCVTSNIHLEKVIMFIHRVRSNGDVQSEPGRFLSLQGAVPALVLSFGHDCHSSPYQPAVRSDRVKSTAQTHIYGWTMHTHSSAALHKTHAMIIRISIWLLWHVGALLRLQCAVLHQHCTHQCTTTDAFVLSALTPLMLSWGIFSVHLLTLKSHLEIARFKDIYMDNTVIQRVSQRFLQLKIWIVIKVHCPYSSSRGCKFTYYFTV